MRSSFVTLIGAGNVAWHLAPALDNTEFQVREVYSKTRSHADQLVSKLYEASVADSLDFETSSSTIFILAVSDDAIEEVAQNIILPENAILVHTSGSAPLQLLDEAGTTRTGVMYPLQTFTRKRKLNFQDIPIFLESNDPPTLKQITQMANAISHSVRQITDSQRQALHVAAVFASNFTNHMLRIAETITKGNKLEYGWLHPLIAETLNKSLGVGPAHAQTGPAKRKDLQTLDRHLEFLGNDDQLSEIYRQISQHILDTY